jgi:hypothetical protein
VHVWLDDGWALPIVLETEASDFMRRITGTTAPAAQPPLPPFDVSEAATLLALAKQRNPQGPAMSEKEIRAWVSTRYFGGPTGPQLRRLMKVWPNRKRGPRPDGETRRNPSETRGPR